MTFIITNPEGYVCEAGNLRTLDELEKHCPDFLKTGVTKDVQQVSEAFRAMGMEEEADAVSQAKPPLVLSDGMVEDEGEESGEPGEQESGEPDEEEEVITRPREEKKPRKPKEEPPEEEE